MRELRRQVSAITSAPARRTITARQAAAVYGIDPRRLRALHAAGLIRGREIAGRGRTGRVLMFFAPSLDAFFSGEKA